MSDVWGVTFHNPEAGEGISVIELFDTEDAATAFSQGLSTRRADRRYGVTKFKVWSAPIRQLATGLGG